MKRKIRNAMEIAIPLLGMGIIFLSVLFAPDSLQIQVLLVLFGVLILEAGVWGLTSGILPNERRYFGLRDEGDHFIGLIRDLNAAAVARKKGDEEDGSFQNTLEQMHGSVERMAELAGVDALETAAEAKSDAAGTEAEPAEVEAGPTGAVAAPARAEAEPADAQAVGEAVAVGAEGEEANQGRKRKRKRKRRKQRR